MENDLPIRVAQVVGKMVGGGVESFIMNYYRYIDRKKVRFDFIIDEDSTYVPKEEIERLGGKIIVVPAYQHIFKYIKALTKVFKENKYDVVHSNLNSLSVFPLFCAKIANIPIRIAHSHSTTNKIEWKKNLLKNLLKPFSKVFANEYFCCTEQAGRWLFGNSFFDSGKVKIINNAIDLEKFKYDENIRNRVRKELNLEGKFVIGHVGRFISQKNHDRILQIFKEYNEKNSNSVLILIGDGILQDKIKIKAKELSIDKCVMFLGLRQDVNELFQAMDLFLFPSLYEGLGIVLIEAQCSGLKCLASTEVPKCAKVTENLKFITLASSNTEWANNIKEERSRTSKISEISNCGYDIKKEANKLLNYYVGGNNVK